VLWQHDGEHRDDEREPDDHEGDKHVRGTYSRPKSLGTYDHHRRPTSGMPTAAIAAHRPMISSLGER
jgi:hypothetical protein